MKAFEKGIPGVSVWLSGLGHVAAVVENLLRHNGSYTETAPWYLRAFHRANDRQHEQMISRGYEAGARHFATDKTAEIFTPEYLHSVAAAMASSDGYYVPGPFAKMSSSESLEIKLLAFGATLENLTSRDVKHEHYREANRRYNAAKGREKYLNTFLGLGLLAHFGAHGKSADDVHSSDHFSVAAGYSYLGAHGLQRSVLGGGFAMTLFTESGVGANHVMDAVYLITYVNKSTNTKRQVGVWIPAGMQTSASVPRSMRLALPIPPSAEPKLDLSPRKPINKRAALVISHITLYDSDVLKVVNQGLKDMGVDTELPEIQSAVRAAFAADKLAAHHRVLRHEGVSLLLPISRKAPGLRRWIGVTVTLEQESFGSHQGNWPGTRVTVGGQGLAQVHSAEQSAVQQKLSGDLHFRKRMDEHALIIGRFDAGVESTSAEEHVEIETKRDIRRAAAIADGTSEFDVALTFKITFAGRNDSPEPIASVASWLNSLTSAVNSVTNDKLLAAWPSIFPKKFADLKGAAHLRLQVNDFLTKAPAKPGTAAADAAMEALGNGVEKTYTSRLTGSVPAATEVSAALATEFGKRWVNEPNLNRRIRFGNELVEYIQVYDVSSLAEHTKWLPSLAMGIMPNRPTDPPPTVAAYETTTTPGQVLGAGFNWQSVVTNIAALLGEGYVVPALSGKEFVSRLVLGRARWLTRGPIEALAFPEESIEHEHKTEKSRTRLVNAQLQFGKADGHDERPLGGFGYESGVEGKMANAESAGDYVEHNRLRKGQFDLYYFDFALITWMRPIGKADSVPEHLLVTESEQGLLAMIPASVTEMLVTPPRTTVLGSPTDIASPIDIGSPSDKLLSPTDIVSPADIVAPTEVGSLPEKRVSFADKAGSSADTHKKFDDLLEAPPATVWAIRSVPASPATATTEQKKLSIGQALQPPLGREDPIDTVRLKNAMTTLQPWDGSSPDCVGRVVEVLQRLGASASAPLEEGVSTRDRLAERYRGRYLPTDLFDGLSGLRPGAATPVWVEPPNRPMHMVLVHRRSDNGQLVLVETQNDGDDRLVGFSPARLVAGEMVGRLPEALRGTVRLLVDDESLLRQIVLSGAQPGKLISEGPVLTRNRLAGLLLASSTSSPGMMVSGGPVATAAAGQSADAESAPVTNLFPADTIAAIQDLYLEVQPTWTPARALEFATQQLMPLTSLSQERFQLVLQALERAPQLAALFASVPEPVSQLVSHWPNVFRTATTSYAGNMGLLVDLVDSPYGTEVLERIEGDREFLADHTPYVFKAMRDLGPHWPIMLDFREGALLNLFRGIPAFSDALRSFDGDVESILRKLAGSTGLLENLYNAAWGRYLTGPQWGHDQFRALFDHLWVLDELQRSVVLTWAVANVPGMLDAVVRDSARIVDWVLLLENSRALVDVLAVSPDLSQRLTRDIGLFREATKNPSVVDVLSLDPERFDGIPDAELPAAFHAAIAPRPPQEPKGPGPLMEALRKNETFRLALLSNDRTKEQHRRAREAFKEAANAKDPAIQALVATLTEHPKLLTYPHEYLHLLNPKSGSPSRLLLSLLDKARWEPEVWQRLPESGLVPTALRSITLTTALVPQELGGSRYDETAKSIASISMKNPDARDALRWSGALRDLVARVPVSGTQILESGHVLRLLRHDESILTSAGDVSRHLKELPEFVDVLTAHDGFLLRLSSVSRSFRQIHGLGRVRLASLFGGMRALAKHHEATRLFVDRPDERLTVAHWVRLLEGPTLFEYMARDSAFVAAMAQIPDCCQRSRVGRFPSRGQRYSERGRTPRHRRVARRETRSGAEPIRYGRPSPI
ncbi:hypothetical protein Pflav_011130 [Phytohabitans flavus]|uniref:Uncharacterized protein n=2 Tax=Phytohabitans flavus TaxID=1076124 RepID=A0A6F8XLM0_9ACTN|nr:hypothetical protein [Phytohabitans flavus]BCB74703.1 hypothetical protein Pflav_011130 [Phytohabitans flavus]